MPLLQPQDRECAIQPGCPYNIEVISDNTRSNITYTVPGMYIYKNHKTLHYNSLTICDMYRRLAIICVINLSYLNDFILKKNYCLTLYVYICTTMKSSVTECVAHVCSCRHSLPNVSLAAEVVNSTFHIHWNFTNTKPLPPGIHLRTIFIE